MNLRLLFHDAECIWDISLSCSRLKPSVMPGWRIWFRGKSCGGDLKNLSAFPRPAPQWMNVFVSISTTARKLAVIIWNMVVKKVPYIPQTEYQFLDQKRKKIAAMKKLITKFDISTNDLNLQLWIKWLKNVNHNFCAPNQLYCKW